MDQQRLAALADDLLALHRGPDILVLVNAWDVASARLVEDAGYPAVATTSAGVAASLGYADGERIPPEDMLAAVARMARAVRIPLSADMEAGYGLSSGNLVSRLLEAGAVGLNIEDSAPDGGEPLVEAEAHAERVASLRQAADGHGVHLVVNARVDVYLEQVGEPDWRFDETLRRATLYREAGADVIFVPGVRDEDTIERLVTAIDAPLNVLAGPGAPPIPRLAALGVARISVGSGSTRVAYSAFRRLAQEMRDQGTYGPAVEPGTLTHAEVNRLFE